MPMLVLSAAWLLIDLGLWYPFPWYDSGILKCEILAVLLLVACVLLTALRTAENNNPHGFARRAFTIQLYFENSLILNLTVSWFGYEWDCRDTGTFSVIISFFWLFRFSELSPLPFPCSKIFALFSADLRSNPLQADFPVLSERWIWSCCCTRFCPVQVVFSPYLCRGGKHWSPARDW